MPGTLIHDEPDRSTQPDLPDAAAVDERPRATLPDVDDAPHDDERLDGTPPPEPKRPRSWVFFLIGLLLFLSAAGPLIFYFAVWRYRPTAPQHIPPGTIAAVRLDGRELYLYEPFREHILGNLQGAAGRAQKFKKHTNIDVESDVREIVLATATGESWVVLFGGHFGSARGGSKFEKGLLKFFEEEGITGFALEDEAVVGHGVFIAQAEDTTVVVASSRETMERALEPSDTNQRLGLASSGALSFVVDRPAFEAAAKIKPLGTIGLFLPADTASHASDAFGHTEKMTGYVTLGREPELLGDIIPIQHIDPMTLSNEWQALQKDARSLADALPEAGGAKTVLFESSFKPRAKSVMINGAWPKEKLDAGLEALGKSLKEALPKE